MNGQTQTRVAAVRIIGLPALLMLLAVGGGCGPTRTTGTSGMAAKDLAVLSIAQLPHDAHVQIEAIQFDDAGESYEIGKGRDFYLKPGDHTANFNFIATVPKIEGMPTLVGWIIPAGKSFNIPGPKKVPLGAVTAGKTYELAPPSADSFDKLLQTGQLSLVREKAK
jgi:hypothetical protein